MGSQTILDLIASTMVFSSLLLMAMRLNASVSTNLFAYKGDLIVQQNLVEIVKLLEYDFRKIGYCKDPSKIPDPTRAIRYADSIRIKFYTDLATTAHPYGDGNIDSLDYYMGGFATATPNPFDRLIYRVENNATPVGINLGVTTFNLLYFDATKTVISYPITNYGSIATLQITVQCQNLAAYSVNQYAGRFDSLALGYQSAYWRQVRLVARNLRNR
jgi:hypothetical protein